MNSLVQQISGKDNLILELSERLETALSVKPSARKVFRDMFICDDRSHLALTMSCESWMRMTNRMEMFWSPLPD